jgi:hypothetical protein
MEAVTSRVVILDYLQMEASSFSKASFTNYKYIRLHIAKKKKTLIHGKLPTGFTKENLFTE